MYDSDEPVGSFEEPEVPTKHDINRALVEHIDDGVLVGHLKGNRMMFHLANDERCTQCGSVPNATVEDVKRYFLEKGER